MPDPRPAPPDPDRHAFGSDRLRAAVLAEGAELCSLATPDGVELLWQAGPEWPRRAPWLFPVVGRLAGDALRVGGAAYPMRQHGFARARRFAWAARGPRSCRLVLRDDAATREAYPFPFRFEVAFAVEGATLSVSATVTNPGEAALPVSLGAHPAFRWPLRPGSPREAHALEFERPEPDPVRRLEGGLLARREPTPVEGRRLALRDALFEGDALILDPVRSRHVRYAAPGAPGLVVGWEGAEQLGLWTRPGAGFLCIEPWRGLADPAGFDGAFADKPGLLRLPPGGSHTLSWHATAEG